MKISKTDAALIRAGFAAVDRDRAAAALSFYANLFRIAPDTRGLFVTDLERQGMKLMDTLAVVVEQVDTWGRLVPALEELALRHTAYGVRPEHYAPTGAALLAMLAERLGPDWTPDMADAWGRVYDAIQAAMIASAYRPSRDDLD